MSSDSDITRVLVLGDVRGQFNLLLERLDKANTKAGPFALVICVGDFFNPENSRNQEWIDDRATIIDRLNKLGLHLYVMGPSCASQTKFYQPSDGSQPTAEDFDIGFELIEGVTFLGKCGVLKTSAGLRIAYLSGRQSTESIVHTFTDKDAERLIDQVKGAPIDILVTSAFPRAVLRYAELEHEEELQALDRTGSLAVARLAAQLKPRYHFCGHPHLQVERLPYRNFRVLIEPTRPVTRFILLAGLGNAMNRKHLYAFFIKEWSKTPVEELNEQPLVSTENPYFRLDEYIKEKGQGGPNFFFDTSGQSNRHRQNAHQQQQNQPNSNSSYAHKRQAEDDESDQNSFQDKRQRGNPAPGQCWFCLASSEVEKHLIISVGDENYLALAKGGLVEENFLLLPIAHCRNVLEMPDQSKRQQVLDEQNQFKQALKQYFALQKQVPVFFERNFRSQHAQIQVIPIPEEKQQTLVQLFLNESNQQGLRVNELPPGRNLVDELEPSIPFFYFEVGNQRFFIRIRRGGNFRLQYGRELLAHPQVLDLTHRLDWRDCVLEEKECKQLVEDIRKRFQPFDFTL